MGLHAQAKWRENIWVLSGEKHYFTKHENIWLKSQIVNINHLNSKMKCQPLFWFQNLDGAHCVDMKPQEKKLDCDSPFLPTMPSGLVKLILGWQTHGISKINFLETFGNQEVSLARTQRSEKLFSQTA